MRKRRVIPLLLVLWLAFNLPLVCPGQGDDLAALRKKAEDGDAVAQVTLGMKYAEGEGVEKDGAEAVRWYRRAAEQNHVEGQFNLGWMLANGEGVERDDTEAVRWYRQAAEQDHAQGQLSLGWMYANGLGVVKDDVAAYLYYALAARTDPNAARNRDNLKRKMSPRQVAEAQRLVREWKLRPTPDANNPASRESGASGSARSGTGFAVTEDGFIVTSEQVVSKAVQVRVMSHAGIAEATVVRLDPANDIALLKVNTRFTPLPVAASRSVRSNQCVATVGFPDLGLQKFAPKLVKGEISGLAGIQDDPRHFQITAPIQPGNTGGALFDERGNVIGVLVAQPRPKATTPLPGAAPAGTVHYAVKSTFLMGFLESLPDVVARLKDPDAREREFEDVVKDVENATVRVLIP